MFKKIIVILKKTAMFEHHKKPLASKKVFLHRIIFCTSLAILVTLVSLLIGMLGYYHFEKLSLIDSLLNASMILGGMGPVAILQTDIGKLFASFYAIFSGTIFLVVVGILVAPIFHRFLHKFHLEDQSSK